MKDGDHSLTHFVWLLVMVKGVTSPLFPLCMRDHPD